MSEPSAEDAPETVVDDEFEFDSIEEDSLTDEMEDLDDPFDDPAVDNFEDDDMGDDEGYF
ncbi:MAG TPA: hypothetical protein DCL41_07690 [Bdellovibrionales bacterium]|nr:hypothetical protein [Pseudobdellovibrionaceae bacterium]HAG91738.1 hypothetical protein [Bdellovibrionales bacterium]